jgi:ribose transport system substrate-binding protein
MRKNKLGAALGATGLALVAAASIGPAAQAAPAKAQASKLNITFVAALVNDSYFVTIKCGALAAGKSLGVNVKWEGPTSNSVSAEVSAMQAAAVTKPDGMVLAPFSNVGWTGIIRPLMAKGVPVVLSGQAVKPADGLTTYISNFLKGGNSLAGEIGKLTGGKGTMAIVADSTGNPTDSDRYTGLVPILKKKYPNLKVVGPQYAANSTAKAASVTSSLIIGNPDLNLVYASSGPEAVGAASAIAAAKKTGKIKLISFDSSPPQIDLLKKGQLAATIGQSPFLTGKLTVTAAVKWLKAHPNGGKVPASAKLSYTPTQLLTPKNVNTGLGKQYQYKTSC